MRVPNVIAACWLVACLAGCSPSGELAAHPHKPSAQPPSGPFLVKPYLQAGEAPGLVAGGSVQLLWHTEDADAEWAVECRTGAEKPWQAAPAPTVRRIAVEGVPPHRLFRTELSRLEPGGEFSYRVRKGGEIVFSAEGRGPRPAGKPQKFVVFGDCGANTEEQRTIAYRAYQAGRIRDDHRRHRLRSRPDLRVSREVLAHLQRRRGVAVVRGRRCCGRRSSWPRRGTTTSPSRDLGKYPDGLAYFLYWDQPLNGPAGEKAAPHVATPGVARKRTRRRSARPPAANYPRMAQLLVRLRQRPLDGPGRQPLRGLDRSRAAGVGRAATWPRPGRRPGDSSRFHQPGFKSARKHSDEQNMRVMADVFEAGGWTSSSAATSTTTSGPTRSVSSGRRGAATASRSGTRSWSTAAGRSTSAFDGHADTRPKGSSTWSPAAGGPDLYNPEQQDDPSTWQEFTHKFVSKVHSLTVADVDGRS